MPVHFPDSTVVAMNPAHAAPSEAERKASSLLYQAGTVFAILLFLLSFWSC